MGVVLTEGGCGRKISRAIIYMAPSTLNLFLRLCHGLSSLRHIPCSHPIEMTEQMKAQLTLQNVQKTYKKGIASKNYLVTAFIC